MTTLSPLAAYHHAINLLGFQPDPAQAHAAQALELCQQALNAARKPLGVYLFGPVGRGKTWLMDTFYQSLNVPARRQHFHHFMRWVHQRQFQLTGTPDPLQALARELANDVRVLCFDELFVSDIGDAMLLGRLFQVMFDHGVVLVSTSNQPPQQLYADGFNRERFLPAIAAIEQHMQVISVDGQYDHRLHPGTVSTRYWLQDEHQLEQAFAKYAEDGASSEPVIIGPRHIDVVQRSAKALWCRFAQLCEQPLASGDFIALCDHYQAIFLSDVPALGGAVREAKIARGTEDGAERVMAGDRQLPALSAKDDSVRRFIALVDECYDRRVPLYIEAEVPLDQLYTQGYLEFAFRRTLSRLQEMQLARFTQA